jgi:hypothetical protein
MRLPHLIPFLAFAAPLFTSSCYVPILSEMEEARIDREDQANQARIDAAHEQAARNTAASIDMSLSEYQYHQQAMRKEMEATGAPIQNTAAFREFKRRAYITSKGKPAY